MTYTQSLSIRNALMRNNPLNFGFIRNGNKLNFSTIRNNTDTKKKFQKLRKVARIYIIDHLRITKVDYYIHNTYIPRIYNRIAK